MWTAPAIVKLGAYRGSASTLALHREKSDLPERCGLNVARGQNRFAQILAGAPHVVVVGQNAYVGVSAAAAAAAATVYSHYGQSHRIAVYGAG